MAADQGSYGKHFITLVMSDRVFTTATWAGNAPLDWETNMKSIIATAVLFIAASSAFAKDPVFHQQGTITNMDAVECGVDENSGKSLAGEVLGTDSGHKKTRELLCQEYVLKTDRIMYRIRPRDEKHPVLLPVGETAEFRIKKDKMLLSIPELGDKEREYSVTSMQIIAPQSDVNRSALVK